MRQIVSVTAAENGADEVRDELAGLVARTNGLAEALGAVLDRVERDGRWPTRVTVRRTSPAVHEALARVFSPRAVRILGDDTVRLDLAALRGSPDALVAALYAAVARIPRSPADEARARAVSLERLLVELGAEARLDVARAWLAAERTAISSGRSTLIERAVASDAARAISFARAVVHCLDAVCELREPVRVQTFAARVVGNSKALRPGGDLHAAVCDALFAHDPRTFALLEEQGVFPSEAAYRAFALEAHGVLFDEAAASVLCFGPLRYRKARHSFDHVAQHAALGESCRLVVQQLRDAELEPPAARRITIFENLAPYLEYVDALVAHDRDDEIVVCSGGQANLAVIGLLRMLARYALPARHLGDLDRSGVLILRSLIKRSGLRIEPTFMDPETHRRFAEQGRPLTAEELARLRSLIAADPPSAPCHALLREIAATKTWIEQEVLSDQVLAQLLS